MTKIESRRSKAAQPTNFKRFGGEGTGGQCFFDYDWKIGQTYRFLVTAEVKANDPTQTDYAGYFYLPETKTWKHLVTFRTTAGGDRLAGLYSFVEDFRRDTTSATETRRATFANGWVQMTKGNGPATWQPLVEARFTASGASWEAKDTIDAGVEEDGQGFYLQTGGDTHTHTALKSTLKRPAGHAEPPQVPEIGKE